MKLLHINSLILDWNYKGNNSLIFIRFINEHDTCMTRIQFINRRKYNNLDPLYINGCNPLTCIQTTHRHNWYTVSPTEWRHRSPLCVAVVPCFLYISCVDITNLIGNESRMCDSSSGSTHQFTAMRHLSQILVTEISPSGIHWMTLRSARLVFTEWHWDQPVWYSLNDTEISPSGIHWTTLRSARLVFTERHWDQPIWYSLNGTEISPSGIHWMTLRSARLIFTEWHWDQPVWYSLNDTEISPSGTHWMTLRSARLIFTEWHWDQPVWYSLNDSTYTCHSSSRHRFWSEMAQTYSLVQNLIHLRQKNNGHRFLGNKAV